MRVARKGETVSFSQAAETSIKPRPPTVGDRVRYGLYEGEVFRDPGYLGADGRWWLGVRLTSYIFTWEWTVNRDDLVLLRAE